MIYMIYDIITYHMYEIINWKIIIIGGRKEAREGTRKFGYFSG